MGRLQVDILYESEVNLALYGLGLSHGLTSHMNYAQFCKDVSLIKRLYKIAVRLAPMGGGHNKFLESIQVWLEMTMPRYIWQDLDTYRVGMTKQSESTNHTLIKQEIMQHNFEQDIDEGVLNSLNALIKAKDFMGAKRLLPESFLQKRIVCTNYKCLQNIIKQRQNHKLPVFRQICTYLMAHLSHPELLGVKQC